MSDQTTTTGRLQGKVAIVTGGSQGIGRSIAVRYGAEGARVAVVNAHRAEVAAAVADEINTAGGEARSYQADCSDVAAIEGLVAQVIADFGTVDIVVNSAGVFHTVSVSETTEDIWDQTMDLNLKGLFFMVKSLLPEFRRTGGGKVVNITSIAGTGAFPNCPAYCASKGGAVNLTRALAAELGKEKINVNSIAPGNVATDLNAHVREDEEYVQTMANMTPTGIAFMQPDDIAGTAVFLACEDSDMIHGTTIIVDAGWSVW
jgi:NAD(P)-dependent dehydrogenase (short-subunit alcohol dehydrogenase family)